MFGKLFVIFLLSCVNIDSISAETSNFVCYHGTWAKYRWGNGLFDVGTIDTSHCTHLVYSFVGLKADGSVYSLDDWLDYGLNNLNAFTALKNTRRNLKVLVAIGGWSHSTTFPAVAASPALRAVFLKSALQFVQTHNFDGLDFDWEYPAQRGGTPRDVQNFVTLLQEFKAEFEPLGLTLTAAVSASATSVAASYDVPAVSQYLDMINVMTYDLRGAWDGVTGHNAPLYASSKDVTAADLQLNVDACITNWIERGAAPSKINLGIPLYGRTFTLSSNDVSLGAPASNPGIAGTYTQEAGYLGYIEIVEKIIAGGWTYVWDDEQQVPHIYNGNQWIGYDDPRAVTEKVKYAQSKGLGGVMVWAIETDDHKALSGTKNPLLSAITNQLAAGSSSGNSNTTPSTTTTTTTKRPDTTTTASTTTKRPDTTTTASTTSETTTTPKSTETTTTSTTSTTVESGNNNQSLGSICKREGYIKDSSDCSKFYRCTKNADGSLTSSKYTCGAGLYFDASISTCNWRTLVAC